MTPQEFVEALHTVTVQSVIGWFPGFLERVPGRRPPAKNLELSNWYHKLSPADREHLMRAVSIAARAAVLQTLSVLSGTIQIEDENRGVLELRYTDPSGKVTILSGPAGDALHEYLPDV